MKRKRNKSKVNSLQSQYKKELRNLRQRIRYHSKTKGLDIDIEDLLPQIDKVSKSAIKELKNIKAEQILSVATIPETTPQITIAEEVDTYITIIADLISSLPDTIGILTGTKHDKNRRYIEYPLYKDKQLLYHSLYDTANSYDNLSEYNDYLSTVYLQIDGFLNPDFLPSTSDDLNRNLSEAMRLILGRPLSMREAIGFGEIDDML